MMAHKCFTRMVNQWELLEFSECALALQITFLLGRLPFEHHRVIPIRCFCH